MPLSWTISRARVPQGVPHSLAGAWFELCELSILPARFILTWVRTCSSLQCFPMSFPVPFLLRELELWDASLVTDLALLVMHPESPSA